MTNREWLANIEDIDELVELLELKCNMCAFKMGKDNCVVCGCKTGIGLWLKTEQSGLKIDIESIVKNKTWDIETLAYELEKMGYKK